MGSAGSNAGLLFGGTCLPGPFPRRSHDKVLKQFNAKMCLDYPARIPAFPQPCTHFLWAWRGFTHTFLLPFFALFSTCAHNGNELEL